MFEKIVEILSSKLGSYYLKNNQVSFFCPKHPHHKRKLEVNLEKGVYHCWIGDEGGHILKLCYDLHLSDEDKKIFHEQYAKKETDLNVRKIENVVIDDRYFQFFSENSYPFITNIKQSSEVLKNKALNYLYNRRQVLDDDIIKFSIQYGIGEQYKNSIVIPSFANNGKINGVVVRHFSNPIKKYFQMKQSDLIWNELFIDWDDNLFIVEGMFDYLKIEGNGLCLVGSLINEESSLFSKLIQHKKEKYFCLDKDAMLKSINIIKKLIKIGVDDIFILEWPKDSKTKDIGEFESKEDVMWFIKQNMKPVTQSNVDMLELKYKIGI